MRTNIVIDDKLMADVMALGGFKTKREAVEEGLRLIVRRKAYQEIRQWRGKLHWTGDDTQDWSQDAVDQSAQALVPEPMFSHAGQPA
ncbi:MAG: type II toxin-antitoxin system VapB family antitoxin [Rhodoferax sp.]